MLCTETSQVACGTTLPTESSNCSNERCIESISRPEKGLIKGFSVQKQVIEDRFPKVRLPTSTEANATGTENGYPTSWADSKNLAAFVTTYWFLCRHVKCRSEEIMEAWIPGLSGRVVFPTRKASEAIVWSYEGKVKLRWRRQNVGHARTMGCPPRKASGMEHFLLNI